MRTAVVIDTNVVRVGDGDAEQAGPDCVDACVDRMERVKEEEKLILDDGNLILREYLKKYRAPLERKPGHAFTKWAWRNRYNKERCKLVSIEADCRRGFVEFPDDDELTNFDDDDRMFVAVAIASGESPPIVNAADRGWWKHRFALARHAVEVDFVCPELMKE